MSDLTATESREAPEEPTALFGLEHKPPRMAEVLSAPSVAEAQAIALRRAREVAALPVPPPPTQEEMAELQAAALAGHMARLGFPVENWCPSYISLPEEWRGRAGAYISSLPQYVNAGVGLLVSARMGSGKTSLLALVARAAQKHDITCAYVMNGRTLLYQCRLVDRKQEARAGGFDATAEEADLRKHWPHESTELVLLDDVDYIPGGGYDPEREAWDVIGAYLYERMARGQATCVATNLPPSQLLEKPGMDRVRDRATVYLPDTLHLVTQRGSQRGEARRDLSRD